MYLNYSVNLRAYRQEYNLSLRQLAEKTDISKSELSSIERGEKDARVATIGNLAKFFECDLSHLIKF